jgi:hypothetical protein
MTLLDGAGGDAENPRRLSEAAVSAVVGEVCRCPSCVPWVSTRTSWLPFASRLWPGIFAELLLEQSKKRCVFTFAIVEPGWWVAGDMSVADAIALPVGGTA